jgi:epoxyqueuosine reductase
MTYITAFGDKWPGGLIFAGSAIVFAMALSMQARARHTRRLKDEAARLGFAFAGVARAERMDAEARRLEDWLNQGLHGEMAYMTRYFEQRIDPTVLLPGARSVVVLMHNYYPARKQEDPAAPKLARYAYGDDYHHVLKRKLRDLLECLRREAGPVEGRYFVDSAPVLERDWARRAGLGWVGKNTLLLHPRAGSYFFLAVLIVDLEMAYDSPIRDYCGTCQRCIVACPTGAIAAQGYVVDARRCISYLTIELRSDIPESFAGKMENWMFGCDICQEVCPWNRFSRPHQEPAFEPHPQLLPMSRAQWLTLDEATYRELFRRSAVKRAKFKGLKRNIAFLDRAAGEAKAKTASDT